MNQYDVDPHLLEIEITESILIEKEQEAVKFVEQLSELGVQLALDDFGTGYSSLSYLAYIPFGKVKLDRSLTGRFLETDNFLGDENLETMTSLIELFHSLNLPVVAEGIETKEQYIKLKENDCDYIQGYLFSKPVDKYELEGLITKNFTKKI